MIQIFLDIVCVLAALACLAMILMFAVIAGTAVLALATSAVRALHLPGVNRRPPDAAPTSGDSAFLRNAGVRR